MQFSISTDTILLWCAATAILLGVIRAPYLVFDEEKKRADSAEAKLHGYLKFVRAIRREGTSGRYSAYATVRNTNLATKLTKCRCEIAEIRNHSGEIIQRNIGLRTRGQQADERGGRFNLDQSSEKDIPLFEFDQLEESGPSLYIVAAGLKNIKLEYDGAVLTALVRGYGDIGMADEITVRVDLRSEEWCEIVT